MPLLTSVRGDVALAPDNSGHISIESIGGSPAAAAVGSEVHSSQVPARR